MSLTQRQALEVDTANAPREGDFEGLGLAAAINLDARSRTHWDARSLLLASFPDPRWAVPGLLPEGCTLLAGPPKLGKSWLALDLAVAVAAGGRAFGRVKVDPGDVLYLALEDQPRRLQGRLAAVLEGGEPPARLQFATAAPTIAEGLGDRLADWLTRHPDARLVIVDVLERVRGRVSERANAYQADYAAISALQQVASRGVAVLVLHHVRKADATDFVATLSGTYGLAGAADTIAVLRRARSSQEAVLSITGRDVEEAEHALRFHPARGGWQLLDETPAELQLTAERRQVLALLTLHGPLTPKQYADHAGIGHEAAKKTLRRMADARQISTDGHGLYLADPPDIAVPPVPLSLSLGLSPGDQGHGDNGDTLTTPEDAA